MSTNQSEEQLADGLRGYHLQISQLELLMTDPSTNEASKLELLELQNDLLELIEVTQGSLEV